jgi:hypothetical protein
LTTATICGDLGWHEEIPEAMADHYRAGVARLPRLVRIAIDGRFLVELATRKNAESGKAIEWPPAPLTVRGSFVGQPQRQSLTPRETAQPPK